jgi:polyisoprenoid-binding protein YceI
MKRSLAFVLALVLPALAAAQATTWEIDPAHSSSNFSIKHLVVSTVRGSFGKTTGTIKLDDKDLAKSSVEATIDVNTIDTRVENRDKDLKSPNFFDAEKHPTMTFKSTKVQKAGGDKLKVTGDLTIKDQTKPVVLNVTYSKPVTGMKGEQRRAFNATTKINRKDFGLTYSKVVEAGPVVGDQVDVSIDIEAIKAQPQGEQAKAKDSNKAESSSGSSGAAAPSGTSGAGGGASSGGSTSGSSGGSSTSGTSGTTK